jgi:hypothetical protein
LNAKLILQLSLFGLAMALATVYVIPSRTEPLFWLAIFVVCAAAIARIAPGKFFLHGLLVGLLNSVWITAAHVLLFDSYIVRHPEEAEMMRNSPLAAMPRLMMLITGPIIGALSGVILGLFAVIAGKLMGRKSAA